MVKIEKQIGRYTFDILSPIARITNDDGGQTLKLAHGVEIALTKDEVELLDAALDLHKNTLQVYGMCIGAGLRAHA